MLAEQLATPETVGLLALMLLHDSRRPARLAAGPAYVPLDRQDRTLWNKQRAAEGRELLLKALAHGRPGPYQIQAAISAVHSDATHASDTDWPQIAGLYAALYRLTPSPVVMLNRAIALGHAESPQTALGVIDDLAEALIDYQPFHAARAQCLGTLGRSAEAREAYARAIQLSQNAVETAYLRQQMARLPAGKQGCGRPGS